VSKGQLEQVVINLCVNARDAMPDGGTLRIETANAEIGAEPAGQHMPIPPGRYVTLAVSDTGCGIKENLLSTIFEPFFTTKAEGKGTGLGLAMVYGTITQAGGYILVESEKGRGTSFKIHLPRIDAPPDMETAVLSTPRRGWETILLVEDETGLQEIAQRDPGGTRLSRARCRRCRRSDRACPGHPEPVHLLLTDVIMPRMNGRALAESLRATRPRMKVLYMSGYTDAVIARSGVLESGTLLIEKPFKAMALLARVRAAIESEPRG
jgi:two-component system cell cycle sensor histidine kinase/response regulator CckA